MVEVALDARAEPASCRVHVPVVRRGENAAAPGTASEQGHRSNQVSGPPDVVDIRVHVLQHSPQFRQLPVKEPDSRETPCLSKRLVHGYIANLFLIRLAIVPGDEVHVMPKPGESETKQLLLHFHTTDVIDTGTGS